MSKGVNSKFPLLLHFTAISSLVSFVSFCFVSTASQTMSQITAGAILLLLVLHYVYVRSIASSTPSCLSCKHFGFQPNNPNLSMGICNMFKDKPHNTFIPNYAVHCRNNEHLCGKSGYLYDPISIAQLAKRKEEITLVASKRSGTKSTPPIEQEETAEYYEKKYKEIIQQIKNFNTKRIYHDKE